jgi:hypothetical protein
MANENGNGTTWLGPRLATSHETCVFTIGGVDLEVPALNLFVMQSVKNELIGLGPDLDWISYAASVVRIVYAALKNAHPEMSMTEEELLKACSLKEMRELPSAMNRLLDASGFETGPEVQAVGTAAEVDAGIGTSPPSSQNLPPTASVAETQ